MKVYLEQPDLFEELISEELKAKKSKEEYLKLNGDKDDSTRNE